MRVIDLTHTLNSDISVYPGSEKPKFTEVLTIEKNGAAEKLIEVYTHSGTHMDAPAHMCENGKTLDQFNPSDFLGKALIIDVTHLEDRIGFEDILPFGPWLSDVKFVFFRTGWSKYWGTDKYLKGYPVLTKKAANWLCEQRVRGVGVDTLSVDALDTDEYPVHKILLGCDMFIIENLTGLEVLPEKHIEVACLPMKIEKSDGAPARVIALLER